MTYDFAAERLPDETLMVTAQQTLVLIEVASRRPTPIPDSLRSVIGAFEEGDLER
jgi:acyl-CoA thioesterase FadM